MRTEGFVSLAPVRAQSADLEPFFENSVCFANAVGVEQYLYGMYDENRPYLYGMYCNFVYRLYVLYGILSPKETPKIASKPLWLNWIRVSYL